VGVPDGSLQALLLRKRGVLELLGLQALDQASIEAGGDEIAGQQRADAGYQRAEREPGVWVEQTSGAHGGERTEGRGDTKDVQ
jgi:hypothetical protein